MLWGVLILAGLVLLPLLVVWLLRRPMTARARAGAPGQFVRLSRGVTHYQWHGHLNGPIAVCVHGLTTPSYVWDALVPGLTMMGYRVLTYDLYGRGYSDRPAGVQDAAFFTNQLEELLADQEVEGGILLMGYSMGGAIATDYAARHPDMLERLVLLAPAGLSYRPGRVDRFVRRVPVLGDWLWAILGGWWLRRGLQAEAAVPAAVADIYARQAAETRWRGFLPAVLSSQRHILSHIQSEEHRAIAAAKIPVAGIWAEKDSVIHISGLGKLAEINRLARQTSVDGAPHALAYTHPKQVIAALQEFLREV